MAGAKSGNFKELISPFLKAKMDEEAQKMGKTVQVILRWSANMSGILSKTI